jgi:hypothetical protein
VRGALTKERTVRTLSSALLMTLVLSLTPGCGSSDLGGDSGSPGERTPVFGTSEGKRCWWSGQQLLEDDDPTTDIWLGTLVCPVEMSDPRVSGEEEWELKEPYYIEYLSSPPTGRFEASVILTTDDGVWRGEGFGGDLWDEQGGLSTAFYVEFIGEGAYEGLIYREWGAQYPGSNGYLTTGYIESAD